MKKTARNAANQEKGDEAHMAESVFDIVAEHPQKQHVENDVLPAAMEKLIADQREDRRNARPPGRQLRVAKQARRDQRVADQGFIDSSRRRFERIPENQRIQQDQADGDVMAADIKPRVGVVQGKKRHGS